MTERTHITTWRLALLSVTVSLLAGSALAAQTDSPQARGRRGARNTGVYKDRVAPNWFAENTCFWYRNDLSGGAKEFILVNADAGTREPAFDHGRLAGALSQATGVNYSADQLPFDAIEIADDVKTVRFTVDGTTWACDLGTYACSKTDLEPIGSAMSGGPGQGARGMRRGGTGGGMAGMFGRRRGGGMTSPDDAWSAAVRDNNIYITSQDGDEEIQLSTDGSENNAYSQVTWSPDSSTLIAWRVEPGDNKDVYLIESSPSGGGRAVLRTRSYDLPGDKLPRYELNLFKVADRKQIKPEVDRFEHGWERPQPHFSQDGSYFTYQQADRGHQRFRVIKVDVGTGAVSNVIDEKTDTFIWTAHIENLNLSLVNWLQNSNELIYSSEMDGWRHLYLADADQGKIVNQITKGHWVVRGIDRIDEEARQIWFNASGMYPDQDPYLVHYYRVNFDGTGLVALTDGNGTHSIQYSPDRRYIIDTYSRVDMAPVNELRRVSDGKLVCKLEEADISELIASGWEAPEVFVAKGRDGVTDIWGIICRPANLDPTKKYPVLEQVYAGPQGSYVPKSFSASRRFSSLTDLGFIVVQADGMGTANRSKAFHDVCWHNLKDGGFPDRILWHKAVGAKYSYYDLDRVGIYGTSAGGQNAGAAVVFYSDFYKAAVANCGCHDNRMDKASWNEQWMGYPVGPQYSECSNIDNAAKLGGYLFLIVGEMDSNVPPESTMRFVDALIKARKDFDLLVVPGANHGASSPVTQRRLQDFFVRHLMHKEPPNRNADEQG